MILVRRRRINVIKQQTNLPDYAFLVLHIVAEALVENHIRIAVAVNFKSHLRYYWSPPDNSRIPDWTKTHIVTQTLRVMLLLIFQILSQFCEALVVIVCQRIVIPNVSLRAEDKELFDMNYVEFIQRDMEGCVLVIRRRSACVSLVSRKDGSISTNLVDVKSFFESNIVPELQNTDVNGFPMLKADLIMFLTAESNVVRSYAANCIEKLLLVKDGGGQGRDVEEAELPEIGENVCYTAQFVHLHNAGRRDEDPISEVNNVKKFFIQSLATRASESPGKY
ncbi:hypothetical protein GIB67_005231 [Kingdonia uniflora]|uniref:Importin N-terminal domain-containing protein n=1 Tax=Kingdonia uniflora TaxID=39325 RepID=A0A7J7NN49_9MAGN|nr:hypothetical protein GIB67_005231 [Kingdonia uniflora]